MTGLVGERGWGAGGVCGGGGGGRGSKVDQVVVLVVSDQKTCMYICMYVCIYEHKWHQLHTTGTSNRCQRLTLYSWYSQVLFQSYPWNTLLTMHHKCTAFQCCAHYHVINSIISCSNSLLLNSLAHRSHSEDHIEISVSWSRAMCKHRSLCNSIG